MKSWKRFPTWLASLSQGRWLLLLVGIALTVRIAWAVSVFPRHPVFDERSYVRHAIDLVEGRGYVDEKGERAAYWPVGYPVVLAAGYELLGQSKATAISLQILFSIATCLLISILGSATFGPAPGRLAALMLAVYPTHVFYSALHLTEPLFTLLITAALTILLRSLSSWPAAILAGFALGLATLVRPVALLLPGFVFVWYWIQAARRRAVVLSLLTGCATLAVLSPWLARNHTFTGKWTVVSTTGGHNFWIGNHPAAFGGYKYSRDIMPALRDQDDDDYDYSRGYGLGFQSILNDPVEAFFRTFRKASYFFAFETDGVMWNLKGLSKQPPMPVNVLLFVLANVAYVAVLALATLGLLTTPRTHPLGSLFLTVSVYLLSITLVFIGDPRYHYVLIPLATVFSGKAVAQDLPALFERKNRRLLVTWSAIVAGFLILMAGNVAVKIAELKALGP